MLNLKKKEIEKFNVLLDNLMPNQPKPGEKGMFRLSNNDKELVLCVCIDASKKELFKAFVNKKGHDAVQELIQKVPENTLYFNQKAICYIYFHQENGETINRRRW